MSIIIIVSYNYQYNLIIIIYSSNSSSSSSSHPRTGSCGILLLCAKNTYKQYMALFKSKQSRDCTGKYTHVHSGGPHFESRPDYRRSFLCSSSVPVVRFTQAALSRQPLPDRFRPNTPLTVYDETKRRYLIISLCCSLDTVWFGVMNTE